MPDLAVHFAIPSPLIDTARGHRTQAVAARYALEEALKDHHYNVMPGHFTDSAKVRYGHMERAPGYVARKRRKYGRATDLIKSGKSRDKMLGRMPRVVFSGSSTTAIKARQRYQWFFPAPRVPRQVVGVSREHMNREVTAWDLQDLARATETLRTSFVDKWMMEVASKPKWRKQVRSKINQI